MKIYIDSDFHCHVTNMDGTLREIETNFFDDKCPAFIEGYCYNDSKGYPQIYPWKTYSELDSVQREYEKQLLLQYKVQNEDYKKIITNPRC